MVRTLTIGLSLLAVALGLGALLQSRRGGRDTGDVAVQEQVARLGDRLDHMAAELQALRATRPLELRLPADGKTEEAAALQQALTQFSQRLIAVEQSLLDTRGEPPTAAPRQAPPPEQVARARAQVVDRALPVTDRIRALKDLRLANARTPEVATAAAEMIGDPALDWRAKSSVIRHVAGMDQPALMSPLLAVLGSGVEDPRVRAEAVEALMPFYSRPEVNAAVTRARDADSAEEVRKEANRRLAQWQSGGKR
jgi:hypothetical protein